MDVSQAAANDDGWDRLAADLASSSFHDVRRVAETGSTNADVLALAKDGSPEGVVLVADHQTAGRGRLGRAWQAPPGSSLLVSILVRPEITPSSGHLVTTALGIAAAEACRDHDVPARLKWPNDLVVEHHGGTRKLSGMLSEALLDGEALAAVVLGIGINVNWPDDLPAELEDIAVAMNHVVGHDVSRPDVLSHLLRRFDHWYGEITTADGRGRMIGRYRELSATIGSRVQIDLGGESVVGDAIDINADGHLLVVDDCPDRPLEIVAGDVVHLRPS